MNISEIMTKQVVTVEMDDTLAVVKDIFDQTTIHHLLVVEEGMLVGVLSDRDLHRSISPNIGTSRFTYRDMETLEKRVHTIMTRHPVTLTSDSRVQEAIDVFNNNSFSCIPVVNSSLKIQGIVTWRDILKNFGAVALACVPK